MMQRILLTTHRRATAASVASTATRPSSSTIVHNNNNNNNATRRSFSSAAAVEETDDNDGRFSIQGTFREGRASYLDMSATTPMDPRVLDKMMPFMVSGVCINIYYNIIYVKIFFVFYTEKIIMHCTPTQIQISSRHFSFFAIIIFISTPLYILDWILWQPPLTNTLLRMGIRNNRRKGT